MNVLFGFLKMTAFVGLLLAVSGSTGFAASTSIRYDWPVINGLPLNNACVTEQTLRSIRPVRLCSATGALQDARCLAQQPQDVEFSRTITIVECAEYSSVAVPGTKECIRATKRAHFVERHLSVRMYEVRPGGEEYAGDVVFTLPECR